MAYRMACDHADQVAGIVSLAGAMLYNVDHCKPSGPVVALHIHGTTDTTLNYDGGTIAGKPVPGAVQSVLDWVALDGCSTTPDTLLPPLDLDRALAGKETIVNRYATDCRTGGHAELWTIVGGQHNPTYSTSFPATVVDFMLAHPKP